MATISSAGTVSGGGVGILDREHTIAKAGFNRWLVPPAALCIHLCIGMAYGFSLFWLPLSRAIGLTAPKACPDMSLMQELFTTTCFGGGTLIGAPLANILINYFKTPTSVGVWETFAAMGVIYFVFMMIGASPTACRRPAGAPRVGLRRAKTRR